MRKIVLVLFFVISAFAQDNLESNSVKLVLKLYDDCSNTEGLSQCLKKKAITFVDRLGRMDKLDVADGVVIQKSPDAPKDEPVVTEAQLEQILPRAADAKDAALTDILMNKVSSFIESRSIEVALPKFSASTLVEEARKGSLFGGGKKGGKKGGKGKKGMMMGLMMGIGAKVAAMIPLAIAGLFLLAKKALIISKIALLISGIIAFKKLFGNKLGGLGGGLGGGASSGGHGGHGGWQSGGGSGGWQSGGGSGGWQSGGGGWDRRSYEETQAMAYNAYKPNGTR